MTRREMIQRVGAFMATFMPAAAVHAAPAAPVRILSVTSAPVQVIPLTGDKGEADYHAYMIRLTARLSNGETLSVPCVWTERDLTRNTPAQISSLFGSLWENGLESLNDVFLQTYYPDQFMQGLSPDSPAYMTT